MFIKNREEIKMLKKKELILAMVIALALVLSMTPWLAAGSSGRIGFTSGGSCSCDCSYANPYECTQCYYGSCSSCAYGDCSCDCGGDVGNYGNCFECGDYALLCGCGWCLPCNIADYAYCAVCDWCSHCCGGCGNTPYMLYMYDGSDNIYDYYEWDGGNPVTLHGISWNSATQTLTLENFDFTSSGYTAISIAADDATIVLTGDNTLQSGDGYNSAAINAHGNLTITGNGSLTATGGLSIGESSGISVSNDFTMQSGTVTAIGGISSFSFSDGIVASGNIIIQGGTLTGIGGNVGYSAGVSALGGSFTMENGTLVAIGENSGVYSFHPLTINGGTLTAIGGEEALYSNNWITINGRYDYLTNTITAATGGNPQEGTQVFNGIATQIGGRAVNTLRYIRLAFDDSYVSSHDENTIVLTDLDFSNCYINPAFNWYYDSSWNSFEIEANKTVSIVGEAEVKMLYIQLNDGSVLNWNADITGANDDHEILAVYTWFGSGDIAEFNLNGGSIVNTGDGAGLDIFDIHTTTVNGTVTVKGGSAAVLTSGEITLGNGIAVFGKDSNGAYTVKPEIERFFYNPDTYEIMTENETIEFLISEVDEPHVTDLDSLIASLEAEFGVTIADKYVMFDFLAEWISGFRTFVKAGTSDILTDIRFSSATTTPSRGGGGGPSSPLTQTTTPADNPSSGDDAAGEIAQGENYVTVSSELNATISVTNEHSVPLTIAVDLGDIGDINHHRLVAIYEDGTIVGGTYNPETGLFEFKTARYGDFTISYVEHLNRLVVQIGSTLIVDLAGNSPTQIMDVVPVIQDGRTLLPVRFIAYAFGANVAWNRDTREVTLTLDGRKLTFPIGEITPELAALGMDVPPQIIENRTFVPLRFISEFFGALVSWDAETQTIEIIKG
jgi:hypothetical protein